eukprot:TRINITY_DN26620_c0_g1_i3.p1 TRINITY_DN26620_c0_g1~~TRINITY_DN26620_c0_g1_i3.p1  ORF type:complete len:102 (+),score=12.60 TRINITY_DN26620_c0_g1_i3:88-393(+)
MASPVWKKWIALVRWIMFSSRTFRSSESLRKRKSRGNFGGSAAALSQEILFTTNDFVSVPKTTVVRFQGLQRFLPMVACHLGRQGSARSGASSSSRHGSVV